MPPQVAARMAVATKAKGTAATSKADNSHATPTTVQSSSAVEKLGAHGAKVKHKRRFCRVEGCERIVKSQGLCQRHGAKPRLCKVQGCSKQAQGNFDGMCKSHFKEHKRKTTPIPKVEAAPTAPQPTGSSVFDAILPSSVDYFPTHSVVKSKMPLVAHLAEGFHGGKPPAWHRNEERKARGLLPVQNPATQLEGWERELVWMEILVLTGVPEVSFRHLARAWGRDKGFHMVLAQFICERHGDVQRKKRKRDEEIMPYSINTERQKRVAAAATVEAPAAVAQQQTAPKTQQEQANAAQQPQLKKKLSVTPEELNLVRGALLTPERKRQIATLLRRKSSGSDKDRPGSVSVTELSADELSLIGADVWDETCYGDSNYNEALAADLFNLNAQESAVLMRRLSVGRQMAADDDSSSIYSRSVASGKTLGGIMSRTSSKDGQQQQNRLTKLDSSASLRSQNSAQIPNTVAVKKAPDDRAQLNASFAHKEGAECLSPNQTHQQQQQTANAQQHPGAISQQQQQQFQPNAQVYDQAQAPAPSAPTYQMQQNQTAAGHVDQSSQHSMKPPSDDVSQFDDAEPKYKYNHHDFRAMPSPSAPQKRQISQASHTSQTRQQYVVQAPAAPEQTQQVYQQPAPALPPPAAAPQYQPPQPPATSPPPTMVYPPQPPQQAQQYQQQHYQAPAPAQHYQQPVQPQGYQHQAPAPAARAPAQQYQRQPQQVPVYQQPAPAPPPPPGPPAAAPVHQYQPQQQQQQFQHTHQTHQHAQVQGLSNHQRQHSLQGLNLHGQPQMEAFHHPPQQHTQYAGTAMSGHSGAPAQGQQLHQQQPSQPGHPIMANQQHSQSNLIQHSQPGAQVQVQGIPPPAYGYQQQTGHQSEQPRSPPPQSFHQRQNSQQLHGQPQAMPSQQPQQTTGQTQSPITYQTSVGHPNQHLPGQTQQQQPRQQQAATAQQVQGNYSRQPSPQAHQYQTIGGPQTSPSQQNQAVYQSTENARGQGQNQQSGQYQNHKKPTTASKDLHDYDHRNEHLQAQEDDHMDVDPSHEHHDYGAEIEHEDHNHQESQQPLVARQQRQSFSSHGSQVVQQNAAPAPAYGYHPGQGVVEHAVPGQGETQQFGHQPQNQNWNHDANYNRASSVSYSQQQSLHAAPNASYEGQQTQVQEHHHQHDHLGQAHFLELPQLGQQTSYASQNSAQQVETAQYAGQEQQVQPQQQVGQTQQQNAQQPGHQPTQNYQQPMNPAYQRQQPEHYVNSGEHPPQSAASTYQNGVDSASSSGHQVTYQGQQQQQQQDTFAQQSEQRYQPQHAQAHGQSDGHYQNHDQQQGQPMQSQQAPVASLDMMTAFQNEAPSVHYQQQQPAPVQGHAGQSPFHQQPQSNAQPAAVYTNPPAAVVQQPQYSEQPQAHQPQPNTHPAAVYTNPPAAVVHQSQYSEQSQAHQPQQTTQPPATYTNQPGAVVQQPQYSEQAQSQAQQDHEAAKNAMKCFEAETHPGTAEALFELPFTTPAAARQQSNAGEQQYRQDVQNNTGVGAESSYSQALEDPNSANQYEQPQQAQPIQQQAQQSDDPQGQQSTFPAPQPAVEAAQGEYYHDAASSNHSESQGTVHDHRS